MEGRDPPAPLHAVVVSSLLASAASTSVGNVVVLDRFLRGLPRFQRGNKPPIIGARLGIRLRRRQPMPDQRADLLG